MTPIYTDKLITITDRDIIFQNYYFPTFKKKVVALDEIKHIAIVQPTLANGKWRIHGTGNFKIWFPLDSNRPKRDRIFIATLKTQWVNIGFTAEDGQRVEQILRSRHIVEEKK